IYNRFDDYKVSATAGCFVSAAPHPETSLILCAKLVEAGPRAASPLLHAHKADGAVGATPEDGGKGLSSGLLMPTCNYSKRSVTDTGDSELCSESFRRIFRPLLSELQARVQRQCAGRHTLRVFTFNVEAPAFFCADRDGSFEQLLHQFTIKNSEEADSLGVTDRVVEEHRSRVERWLCRAIEDNANYKATQEEEEPSEAPPPDA
ncbi:unnamed protein product, partial [Cladocopium goreaui]